MDKDYIGDFANEDYVVKNIRVRPMDMPSGADNQSEHTSKYYTSGMNGSAIDGEFEENKHN